MGQAYWDPEIFGLQKWSQRPDMTIVVDLDAKPQLNKQINIYFLIANHIYRPPHGKTNNLHRRKQRRRSASQWPRS